MMAFHGSTMQWRWFLFVVVLVCLSLTKIVESSSSPSSLKKPPVFGVTASKSAPTPTTASTTTDAEDKQAETPQHEAQVISDSSSARDNSSSSISAPHTTASPSAVSTHGASVPRSNATASSNATSVKNDNLTNDIIPEWKRKLPYPLNHKGGTLRRILVPGPGGQVVTVYLLGTAHVSIDSSHDVKTLLDVIQPNVIFLELCDQRIPLLVAPPPSSEQSETEKDAAMTTRTETNLSTTNATESTTAASKDERKRTPWWKQLKQSETKSMYGMAATLLTSMQQDYADSLGVELGGEFRVAHDYWAEERTKKERKNGIFHLILGDRPLYLTLTRAWESLRLWGKTKLIFGLLVSSFAKPNPEELREWMQSVLADDSGDLLSKSIAELRQHFPTLEEVIIRERDAYMACKLYQTCRDLMNHQYARYGGGGHGHSGSHSTAMEPCTIVAIVGAGHVAGITHWLTVGNGETPEAILSRLVETKKAIPPEDSRSLILDVMEVNHELLQELKKESMSKEQGQQ